MNPYYITKNGKKQGIRRELGIKAYYKSVEKYMEIIYYINVKEIGAMGFGIEC